MNKIRRKAISAVLEQIEDLKTSLEELLGDEETYRDNIPENLQNGTRYEESEDAISDMEDAISNLEDAISALESITE